jgi:NADPH-dependent F420 reductase
VSDDVVAVIGGTGALGFGLAARLAAASVPIRIGSRDADRAAGAARKLADLGYGSSIEGYENGLAALEAAIVVISVPFASHASQMKALSAFLHSGQVVVDASVPLAAAVGGRATRLLGVPVGSAAQQSAELVPVGVDVVAALHTISAANLADLHHQLDEDVLIAGDSAVAKRRVADLLSRIPNLRPVNAGRLETARLIEALTPLLVGMNSRYRTHAGIKVTGLPQVLW